MRAYVIPGRIKSGHWGIRGVRPGNSYSGLNKWLAAGLCHGDRAIKREACIGRREKEIVDMSKNTYFPALRRKILDIGRYAKSTN